MIAVDTNVLLRYWVKDDPAQHAAAVDLLDRRCSTDAPAFVTLVALAEFVWVLGRTYRVGRDALAGALIALLDNPHLRIEQAPVVEDAVQSFLDGHADFSDYLIAGVGRANDATPTHTFDTTAGREPGFALEPAA